MCSVVNRFDREVAMEMRLIPLICLFLICTASGVHAAEMQVVLELRQMRDGEIANRLTLYSNQVDPNTSSIDDRYRLEHNGKPVKAPEVLLARLNHQRRNYSYDSFTRGVSHKTRKSVCMMAGPALGDILYTRYLTYQNYKIVNTELRPVYSDAGNCLFAEVFSPNDFMAEKEALRALTALQTIRDFISW
jgi:hypothetical protein